MKNFDINRFCLALKCQLLSSRRQWLRLFGILTLAMFVMDIFFTRISYHAYESTFEEFGLDSVRHFYEHIIGQTAGVGIFILFGAMMFGACYVFSHLKETRQRTTYLMWPVSNLEKFLICPIVFSDPDLVKFGVTKKVTDILAKAKIKFTLYSDIKPNPTIENVKNGVKAAKKAKADCIVAIGGGSSMDTAKAVGITA